MSTIAQVASRADQVEISLPKGASDHRSGRRSIRTSADTDGGAMVARPGLQPRVRRASVRWFSCSINEGTSCGTFRLSPNNMSFLVMLGAIGLLLVGSPWR